jgi:hypothetical protein
LHPAIVDRDPAGGGEPISVFYPALPRGEDGLVPAWSGCSGNWGIAASQVVNVMAAAIWATGHLHR